MNPQQVPNLGFQTKLWNRKSNRYFIVDGLSYQGHEIDSIGLLDLHNRTRVWRPASEIRQLLLDDVLELWAPVDQKIF
jgi:hypothetical protein